MVKQNIQILISKQALERVKKDRFVAQNKKWYTDQINMLVISNLSRPTEIIGDFKVSPRGREKRRIVWHFEIKKSDIILLIDDFLYHISDKEYIDNWGIKARNKQIRLHNYGPYIPFSGL